MKHINARLDCSTGRTLDDPKSIGAPKSKRFVQNSDFRGTLVGECRSKSVSRACFTKLQFRIICSRSRRHFTMEAFTSTKNPIDRRFWQKNKNCPVPIDSGWGIPDVLKVIWSNVQNLHLQSNILQYNFLCIPPSHMVLQTTPQSSFRFMKTTNRHQLLLYIFQPINPTSADSTDLGSHRAGDQKALEHVQEVLWRGAWEKIQLQRSKNHCASPLANGKILSKGSLQWGPCFSVFLLLGGMTWGKRKEPAQVDVHWYRERFDGKKTKQRDCSRLW